MRLVWLVLPALLVGSCGMGFDDFCTEKADCEGGNEADIEGCEVERSHASERADLYGCSEHFSAFQDCLVAEARCENSTYIIDDNRCEDERRDCNSCMGSCF